MFGRALFVPDVLDYEIVLREFATKRDGRPQLPGEEPFGAAPSEMPRTVRNAMTSSSAPVAVNV